MLPCRFLAGFFALSVFLSAPSIAPAQEKIAPGATPATTGDAKYRIYADVVTSGIGRPGVQGVNCVDQSVFFPGDDVVFRAVIADGATGKPLSPEDVQRLGVQAVVTLSDGTKVPLRLGSHPPPPNAPVHKIYWAARTPIAADHPTGTLTWTVSVTDKAGHSTTFAPMGQDAGIAVLTIAQKAAAPAR
jgi:hypothetical protein